MKEHYYKQYRRAFRYWLIFLIIFTFAIIWYVYLAITEPSFKTVGFLIVFILVILFNYSRIKDMKNKLNEAKLEWEKVVKQGVIEGLK